LCATSHRPLLRSDSTQRNNRLPISSLMQAATLGLEHRNIRDSNQWRSQKFFTGGCVTPIGSTLQSSTDALHCFCRERNFDRRMRHHLPHFLNGNLTDVAEMHHSEHSTATAAHCWWKHALLQLSRRRTRQVCRR